MRSKNSTNKQYCHRISPSVKRSLANLHVFEIKMLEMGIERGARFTRKSSRTRETVVKLDKTSVRINWRYLGEEVTSLKRKEIHWDLIEFTQHRDTHQPPWWVHTYYLYVLFTALITVLMYSIENRIVFLQWLIVHVQ